MLQLETMGDLSGILKRLVSTGAIGQVFKEDLEAWLIGGEHGEAEILVPDFTNFFREFLKTNSKPELPTTTVKGEAGTSSAHKISLEKFEKMSDFKKNEFLFALADRGIEDLDDAIISE